MARSEIIDQLQQAYNMELETVINYLSLSLDLEGIRAKAVQDALAEDVKGELGHARLVGNRIKQLGGVIQGSMKLEMSQDALQPSRDSTDVVKVIRGVLEAEEGAITHYTNLIELCDGVDWVTQNMAIDILTDEEGHKQEFEAFLKEYLKNDD